MHNLIVKNLHVEVEGKEIVKGLSLELKKGEVVAIMGPNGSGKSTLAYALMGHPKYTITKGQIILDGEDITNLAVYKRAALGLFLGFQYPVEVPGVSLSNFLRTSLNSIRAMNKHQPLTVAEFYSLLKEKAKLLQIDQSFLDRYLNEGFSGGEKKRAEILQLAILKPKFAVLDETDSGLDIDALRIVSNGINKVLSKDTGVLLITHYQRILNYVKPDKIYVMIDGRIAKSGGKELAHQLEEKGYDWIMEEVSHAKPE